MELKKRVRGRDFSEIFLQSFTDDIGVVLNAHHVSRHLSFFYARFFLVALIECFPVLEKFTLLV